jgi:hypothetical protein
VKDIVLYLFFFLVLITLVGHGIWVLIRTCIRALSSPREDESSSFSSKCSVCGSILALNSNYCGFCGGKQGGQVRIPADLDFIIRQLERLFSLGRIDQTTYNTIMKAIEEDRARFKQTQAVQEQKLHEQEVPQPSEVKPPRPLFAAEPPVPVAPPIQAAASIQEQPFLERAPQERLERGKAFQEMAVRERIQDKVPERKELRPPRTFAEVLASFMEERSIKWGEVIGGLLIIGCSIALVVSLWAQITMFPFRKFLVFTGMTAGLFGLGFYSAHRWKLPTTSIGVLIISTLLVPLNFLAISAFPLNALPASMLIELAALALFLFFVYQAARVILPRCEWLLVCAVVGPSFTILVAQHWTAPDAAMRQSMLLGILPLVCYWVSTGWVLRRLNNEKGGDVSPAHQFSLLGMASFSALLPFVLLIVNNASYAAALYAPVVTFFGVPSIVTGISNWRRPEGELSGGMRTLATSVAFIGALASLSALLIAWPVPVSLLFVSLINCAICYSLSFAFKPLKLLHLAAIAHLLLGYLIGINLAAENISLWTEYTLHLLGALVSPVSAHSLAFFFLFPAIVAEALRTREAKRASAAEAKPEAGLDKYYAIAAAAVGALSLVLATIHGFGRDGDPQRAALIYAFYSIAAFVIAWRREAVIASWIGSGLALLAVFQAMGFGFKDVLSRYHPLRLSLLVSATVAALAAILVRGERARRLFRSPLIATALFSTGLATVGVLFGGRITKFEMSAGMLWLAIIWALLAVFNRWRGLFAVFQAALTLSVVFGTAAMVDSRFANSSAHDPLMLQAQGIALALLGFAWVLVRLSLRSYGYKYEANQADPPVAAKLLYPPWPAVDHVTIAIAILLLLALSISSLLPFVGSEFMKEAAGAGSWLLALVLAIVLVTGLWVRFTQIAILALIAITSCVTMLMAGIWEPDNSAGLAYYWLSSFGFLIVSLPILFRNQVSILCGYFGWPEMKERSGGLATVARTETIILFVGPVLIMKLFTLLAVIVEGRSDFTELGTMVSLVIPIIVISLTFVGHAVRDRSTGFAISASLMINLAVTMGFLQSNTEPGWLMPVAHLNILTTSLTSLAWVAAMRLWLDSKAYCEGPFGRAPHHILASLSLSLSVIVGFAHLEAIVLNPGSLSGTALSGWIALASLLLLMIACLWDPEYKYAIPGLLFSGLFVIFLLLIDLDGYNLSIASSILLATYGLALSGLWRRRAVLIILADGLKLPSRDSTKVRDWIMITIDLIIAAIVVVSLISIFTFDSLSHRLIVAATALTLPLSIGLLAAGEEGKRLIKLAINLGLLGILIWSWAWIEPGMGTRNYLVAVAVIMSAVVIGFKLWALSFNSFASEWRDSLRPEIPAIVGIGLISLVVLFSIDLQDYYNLGQVMMNRVVVLIVLATLIVLTLASIGLALLPGEDPLGLDKPGRERKKMGYVYAAEAFIVLGVMHARITIPELFGRLFQPFWPLIIMALAFTGVALGELFRRRGREVLAEPLGRTGFFLPLLPVLGFWVSDSRVPFTGLLLLVGLFYGILSVMRRSFFIGLLAAAAGNGGLWHFLDHIPECGFSQHPQLWLIPAALSVLAAARVNRDNLTQEQMAGIRYASLMTIYISSTADIFINGVYNSPWLSLILAVISVAGVITGLMLRVRAFLFMGTGFLLLAVMTMIWTALVNLGWSWLWYATGIAFGILIIYAVAMFEKKRTHMLNLLDQLKQWKA